MKKNIKKIYIFLILTTLTTSQCSEGCLKCSTEDKCLLCDTTKSYKTNVDTCELTTLEACTFINQAGECLSCTTGYYIETTSRKCIAIDKPIENCEFYDSSQSCIICKTDFFLDGLKCSVIEKKIANCLYYVLDEQCNECMKGFLMDFDSKTCSETTSVASCSYFSRVKCEGCMGGFIKNENLYFKELFKFSSTAEKDVVLMMLGTAGTSAMAVERVCEKTALTNCVEYETFDKCKVCAVGHFLSETKTCTEFPLPVISNCQRYSSNTNCIQCANQFFLKNSSTCSTVTDIENCSVFDGTSSSTKCKLCKDEYYLSGSTTCKLRENIIDKCDSLSYNSDSCLVCADNFEKTSDSLKCLPIVADCKEYSSSSKTDTELTCSICKDSFILDGVECKSGTISGCSAYTSSSTFGSQTCDKCNNQFWLDNNQCTQIDPIPSCLNYHSTKDKSCIQCEEGNFNFQIQSVCKTLTPIINCLAYTANTNPLTCDTCVSGYIPNGAKTSCLKINTTNCSFGSDVDTCTTCKSEFALGLGICYPILEYMGKNCQVSDINTKNDADVKTVLCKECKINSIPLDHNGLGVCVKNENLSLHFTYVAVPNCSKWNDGDCINCIEGKFLSDATPPTCLDTCTAINTRYSYAEKQRNACAGTANGCEMMSDLVSSNTPACIKCSTGYFMKSGFGDLHYTNVKPEMGSDLVFHPREVFFSGTCVAVDGKTFNEGVSDVESTSLIANCLYYKDRGGPSGATKIDCVRCKDFHTGDVNNNNESVENCILDTDFEDGAKRYGLDPIWEKLFSSYVCKSSGNIPFVGYAETSDADPTPTGILPINPADKPVGGTGTSIKKSNFCSLAVSDATANQDQTMILNCGLGTYRYSSGDSLKSDVKYQCAACKPGFKATSTDATYSFVKTACAEIDNCVGTNWFNSCSQCAPDHVYAYSSNQIDYTTCTSYNKNENCYSATAGGDCNICKKGYNLNSDNLCDSFTPPNCASSTAFNKTTSLAITLNSHQKAYLFYKYQDTLGCGTCKSGYIQKHQASAQLICTESEYIKTKSDDLDNATSAYIQYCESYSYMTEFLCNKCKAGKLLVDSKDKCVNEITDCVLASDTDAQCKNCKVGYALKNNLCVKGEIENCDSYFNTDNNVELICETCSDGYFKESSDTKCTKSLVEDCKTPTSLRKCSVCMTGFVRYSENAYDYCYPLDTAYQCTAASISNSSEYGASITCSSCELSNDIIVTDIGDSIKTICLAYKKTENCKTHTVTASLETSTFHCSECEDGYFLDQTTEKCTERVNKPSDCLIYNNTEDKCTTCSESTFEEDSGKSCKSFPVGIVGCNNYTSSSTCTGCMTNMHLAGKSCTAILDDALIKDCEFYQNATTCKACKTNYFLSSNTCTKANVSNCEKIKSLDICETCKPGYGLKDTAGKKDCVSVNQLKCLTFTPTDPFPCLICEEDYYPDTDGKCVKANPLITDCTLYKDNSTCVTCKQGSVLSLDKKVCTKSNVAPFIPGACLTASVAAPFCVTCAAGSFMREGACVACGSNGVASGCLACDPFEEEKCIVCMSEYWMNKEGVCTAIVKEEVPVDEEEDWEGRVGVVFCFLIVLMF